MKKLVLSLALICVWAGNARADTVVVIDGNGNVTRQIFMAPTNYSAPVQTVTVPVQTTTVAQPAAQTVTVVRESPVVANSYYYDRDATSAALAAGVTTAVVGGLLFDGFHHHRHCHGWHRPRHWGHRHWWH